MKKTLVEVTVTVEVETREHAPTKFIKDTAKESVFHTGLCGAQVDHGVYSTKLILKRAKLKR